MCKLDLENLSTPRKIVLTVAGVLYGLAILGNARHGVPIIVGVTIFFLAITFVVLLWIK